MLLLEVIAFALIAAPPPARPAQAPGIERLTLEEAVRRAIARSTTSLIAEQEIRRAEGILKEVRAPALPILTASGAATRLDNARTATVITLDSSGNPVPITAVQVPRDQLTANLNLTIPIIAPRQWAAWSHAGEQVDIARTSLEDARRFVAVATARAYLSVMAQHRLVQITIQARDSAKAHLDDAQARLDVGSGNRLDVVRAGQEVAADESQLAQAQSNLTRAREALGVLVAADGPLEVELEIQLPAPPAQDVALQEAEEKRPDVRVSVQRRDSAHGVLNDSWTDYMPLLSAVIQPFYNSSPTISQPDTGWAAGLVLTIPLFDGGARYGLQRERSAAYEESKAELEGLLRQARSDVRTAFDAVQRADESVRSARQAARLAREALEMTTLAYREGATNDLEVVDAERRSRDAEVAALVAEDGARQARIDLLSASGRFP
ncbi:MAG TPA: TolC family protein [Myxococcales bacterium]|nr:TolC family protein [Myxococcales bacterium]